MQKIGTYWYMTIGKSGNPGGVKENVAATHFDFLQTCDLLTSHPAFMKSRSQRQSCKADRPAARMSGFTTAEWSKWHWQDHHDLSQKDANNTVHIQTSLLHSPPLSNFNGKACYSEGNFQQVSPAPVHLWIQQLIGSHIGSKEKAPFSLRCNARNACATLDAVWMKSCESARLSHKIISAAANATSTKSSAVLRVNSLQHKQQLRKWTRV